MTIFANLLSWCLQKQTVVPREMGSMATQRAATVASQLYTEKLSGDSYQPLSSPMPTKREGRERSKLLCKSKIWSSKQLHDFPDQVYVIWSLAKTHMWNKGLILTVHKWNLCCQNVCWWWLLNHWFSGPVQSPLQCLSHPSFPKQNVHQVTNTSLTKKRGLLEQVIVVHVVRRQMLWFCSKWYRFPLNVNIYILNGLIQMFCSYGYCGSNKPDSECIIIFVLWIFWFCD